MTVSLSPNFNMLCSAIIPTRRRVERLRKTIGSLKQTASRPQDIEVVVRVDSDDSQTIAQIPALDNGLGVKAVIGPRLSGYRSMGQFVTEAVDVAAGKWVFLIDDDAWLEGQGWDDQLRSVPMSGYIAQAEFYHLGESRYGSGSCGPVGMFVPNKCWEPLGYQAMASPVDQFWHDLLVKMNGWQTVLLRGITYRHNRDGEDELKNHYAL